MIREVYDNDNAQEIFEVELERAIQVNEFQFFFPTLLTVDFTKFSTLKTGCKTIIIEPTALGEDTERWLYYGNRLYQSSVLTGLTSIFIGKKSTF